jgi:CHASE3 domain sensor protein
MRHGLDRGMVIGIILLAAMTVAIAAISYVNTRRLRDDAGQATLSREFLDTIGAIRTDTRTVQATQRAYLITGFNDYRKPYQEAAVILRADAARLSKLTEGDSEQHGRAFDAARQIESGLASLDEVVKLRGGVDGHNAVVELSRKRGPRSFVDPLLETLARMDLAERDRLALREAETRAAYARATIYGLASAFLGLGALGMFAWVLRRSVLARARYAARLADQRELLNATLISIGDGVIATDADGNVTFLNGVAEALTGWASVEATGLPLTSARLKKG